MINTIHIVQVCPCCNMLLALHTARRVYIVLRSIELAKLSRETCVISTEVISCSWRAAWLSSCSVCGEASPPVPLSSLQDIQYVTRHTGTYLTLVISSFRIDVRINRHPVQFRSLNVSTQLGKSLLRWMLQNISLPNVIVKTVTVVMFKCQSRSGVAILTWKSKADPLGNIVFTFTLGAFMVYDTCRPKSFGSMKEVLQLK